MRDSSTLALSEISDYVNCPMKFKYGSGGKARPIDIRECYAKVIKDVILEYVSSLVMKDGTYTWQRMLRKWMVGWTQHKDDFDPDEFNKYMLVGHTACRYFFDLDVDKHCFAAFDVPFSIPMGDTVLEDKIDIVRVLYQNDKSKRRIQVISLFPGYLGWSNRDKSLSIVMTAYRCAMKEVENIFGNSIIQGYDFIWFDAANSLFHDCNHSDIPEETYYSCVSYLSTIAKAIESKIFYPRFDEGACGRCCFRESCSMSHAVPSDSAREIYKLMKKRKF
jgi:hypothetical protein